MRPNCNLLFVWFWLMSYSVLGFGQEDLQFAPPAFTRGADKVVPVDFRDVNVSYEFDWSGRQSFGLATIRFAVGQVGMPMFLLRSQARDAILDGVPLDANDIVRAETPSGHTAINILRRNIRPDEVHTLTMRFALSSQDVTYQRNGGVRVGFFMSDLERIEFGGVHFYENYGPANFEFDQFALTFNVEVTGSSRSHTIYTNGELFEVATNRFRIRFPDYFNSSALYFHLTEAGRFASRSASFTKSNGEEMPVETYGSTALIANAAMSRTMANLAELEKNFGPIIHQRIVVYATTSFPGGMEYAGATISNLDALSHEVSHFWFGRGVFPNGGNAGWIDEAIASWRDGGYRLASVPGLFPANLSGFSPYRRATTEAAYDEGESVIAYIAGLAGSRQEAFEILGAYYRQFGGRVVSTPALQTTLQYLLARNLTELFYNWVYGRQIPEGDALAEPNPRSAHGHPSRFTVEQLRQLR